MSECRKMTDEEMIQYIRELNEKNDELKNLNEKLKEEIKDLKDYMNKLKTGSDARYSSEIRYRDGMIDALKYAIRCNSIIGLEGFRE